MASKGSPVSSSSDHSEKKALLAQPETLESSDYGTYTEAKTESTSSSSSSSYDTASPAEPSLFVDSGSAATGRGESEECGGAAAENVPSAPTDQPRKGVLGCLVNFLQCWQSFSIYVSDSIFLLPFQVLLIAASISAVVVGSLYAHDCPIATELPFMIITLGSLGVVAETFRVVLVVYFYCSHTLKLLGKMRACIIIVNLFFIVTYAVEMWTFFSYTVSFNAYDHAYCNPVFHTFTSILNSSLLLVLPMLFILHFPAFVFNYFNVGGPGFPIAESR